MSATIKQMANRRKTHGVTRREIQRALGCSESWIRWLEKGLYEGPCIVEWTERYREVLQAAINEKQNN